MGDHSLDERGREIVDSRPMVIEAGPGPVSLREQIRRILRGEISAKAASRGRETFEEANDFDVDDGFEVDPRKSPYELVEEEHLLERPRRVKKEVQDKAAPRPNPKEKVAGAEHPNPSDLVDKELDSTDPD